MLQWGLKPSTLLWEVPPLQHSVGICRMERWFNRLEHLTASLLSFFVSPLTPPMSHLTPSGSDGLILTIVSLPLSGWYKHGFCTYDFRADHFALDTPEPTAQGRSWKRGQKELDARKSAVRSCLLEMAGKTCLDKRIFYNYLGKCMFSPPARQFLDCCRWESVWRNSSGWGKLLITSNCLNDAPASGWMEQEQRFGGIKDLNRKIGPAGCSVSDSGEVKTSLSDLLPPPTTL